MGVEGENGGDEGETWHAKKTPVAGRTQVTGNVIKLRNTPPASAGGNGGWGDDAGGFGAFGAMMGMMSGKGGYSPYGDGKGKGKGKTPGRPDVQEELGTFTGTIKSFSEKSGYGFIDC